ncbi:MAG TPA: DUF429 domain-containing protein [Acidimicrobiales bacterium]|nr:DUF429 domain-containing protein [Acidimicrobiales bacterium]
MVLAVGVDVAEERKGLDLVALDGSRRVSLSLGGLSVMEAVELIVELVRPTIVCIDSPSGWAVDGRRRSGERELAAMGISTFPTGADPGDHPFYRWARAGMSLFDAIAPSYPLFGGFEPAGKAAEVFPEASARLIAGRARRADESKGVFRRSVLQLAGISDGLPNQDRVDAALCALTGLFALDGRWSSVGDEKEGAVLLPSL